MSHLRWICRRTAGREVRPAQRLSYESLRASSVRDLTPSLRKTLRKW